VSTLLQSVTAHFQGRAPVRAKLLIGADGAGSAVRRAALGDAACEPVPTGGVLYRGIVPRPAWWGERYGEQTAVLPAEPGHL
jgi:2-polyprenyl-6-methoxyphenol hydroxylase-like FAD-dependent oxidoreductase